MPGNPYSGGYPASSILPTGTQITITLNGVNYSVWDESTEEDVSLDGSSSRAERIILCDWTQRWALANALIGSSSQLNDGFTFVQGAQYPDATSYVCQRVKMKGDGLQSVGANGMIAYQRARMRLYYVPFWFDQNGIGAEEITFGSVTLNASQTQPTFKWTSGASSGSDMPAAQSPALRYATMDFVESRQTATVNKAAIAACMNKRNSGVFLGMAAETVLFVGARSHHTFTALGSLNYQIDYSFSFLSVGWNKMWNPQDSAFETFSFKDGSELYPHPPSPYFNLTALGFT